MQNKSKKPSFILVGASRCATNWISKCLGEHPEIYVYPHELMFFYHPSGKKSNYELEGIQGYYKRFERARKRVIGEISPGYLIDTKVASTIAKHFPEMKIVISLRNPVKRYASEKTYFKNFQYLEVSEEEAINGSLYYDKIMNYFKVFPKKNIKIIFVEDIKKNPKRFIQDLYKFLEVEIKFIPDSLYEKSNEVSKAKYPFLEKYRQGISKIVEKLKEKKQVKIIKILIWTN